MNFFSIARISQIPHFGNIDQKFNLTSMKNLRFPSKRKI